MYIADNKQPYFAYADLEKAYDCLCQVWYALRRLIVEKMSCACHPGYVLQSSSRVRLIGQYNEEFSVGVCAH